MVQRYGGGIFFEFAQIHTKCTFCDMIMLDGKLTNSRVCNPQVMHHGHCIAQPARLTRFTVLHPRHSLIIPPLTRSGASWIDAFGVTPKSWRRLRSALFIFSSDARATVPALARCYHNPMRDIRGDLQERAISLMSRSELPLLTSTRPFNNSKRNGMRG